MAITVLIEASPLANGTPKTVRMSNAGSGVQAVHISTTEWLPVIQTTPEISWSVLQGGGNPPEFNMSMGTVSFGIGRQWGNQAWSTYRWNGQPFTLWVGDSGKPFSSFTPLLTGTLSGLSRSGGTAELALRTVQGQLDVPALSARYAGTGGSEGPLDARGKLKPRAHGVCLSVEPVPVDPTTLTYQVHGYGPIEAITEVYEFAQPLAAFKGDAADYAALVAMTLLPGEWASCLALGMFRLGGKPDKKLSADIIGAALNGAAPRTVGGIVGHLLIEAGVAIQRIGPNRDGVLVDLPHNWSFYATEQVTVAEIVKKATGDAGAYIFPDSRGDWQTGRLYKDKSPGEFRIDRTNQPLVGNIDEVAIEDPAYKVEVKYDRCWAVHNIDSDISPKLRDLEGAVTAQDAALEAIRDQAEAAAADAEFARNEAENALDDGKLVGSEKRRIIDNLATERVRHDSLQGIYLAYNVNGQWSNYHTAWLNYSGYLNGLSPSLYDIEQVTPVDRTFYLAKLDQYTQAREELYNGITGRASKTSDYSLVRDDNGKKPEDNATKGSPLGSYVAGVEAGALVTKTNKAATDATNALTGVQDNSLKIQDLTTTYGNTASSKASADAAAAARDAAQTAQANAQTARTDSQAARDAAQAAQSAAAQKATDAAQSATSASGSASTASGQATIATQKASDAGTYASTASAKADIATSKAGEASVSASQASTSASDALGSKNSAASSASVAASARDAAGTSKDAAKSSADAAAGSASSAAASNTAAGQSASAAKTSETNASTSAGNASTSASNASTSAADALGSANTATSQAGLAAQARSDAQGYASAANTSAQTASTKADAAGQSATAANQSRIDAQAANGTAQTAATSANTSAVNASKDAAAAQQSATISSSYSATSFTTNDKFANWIDPAGLPVGWANWSTEGNYRWERVPGIGSQYAVRTLNDVNNTQSGFYQRVPIQRGKMVIEVTVRLDANTFYGAGVTLGGGWNIDFARDPDVNGLVSEGDGGGIRNWSKLIDIDAGTVANNGGYLNLHAMQGWTGFGGNIDPRYMVWYGLRLRPATTMEVNANKALADSATNTANITSLSTTVTTKTNALANRTDTLEAKAVATPTTFFVRSAGLGAYHSPYGANVAQLLDGKKNVIHGGGAGMWNVWTLDANGSVNRYAAFSMLNDATQAASMANWINALPPATTIIIATLDEPQGNRLAYYLKDSIENCGGGPLFARPDFKYRAAYILVGVTGIGKGAGQEYYAGPTDNSQDSWLEPSFQFLGGRPVFGGSGGVGVVSAKLDTVEGVAATAAGRTQAYFSKTANVPGASAAVIINAVADNGQATSDIALVAGRVQLRNNNNGAVTPGGLYVVGGQTVIDGSLTANAGIFVGTAKLKVAIAPTDFAVSDGQAISFGYDLGRKPTVEFGSCPVALSSGEVYQPYADSVTSTGFTARLRIVSAPNSTGQSSTFNGSGNGEYQADANGKPKAGNGNYNLSVSLHAQAYAYDNYQ